MLSIFDDVVRERSGFRLVLDGLASLLRQRLLRPQKRSLDWTYRRAQRMNLAWTLSSVLVHIVSARLVNPSQQTMTGELFYTLFPVSLIFALYLNFGCCSTAVGEFASIGIQVNSRRLLLEHRQDSLHRWSDYMGWVLICSMLVSGVTVVVSFLTGPLEMRSWPAENFIVFAILALMYFTVVRRLNQMAGTVVRQELLTDDAGAARPSGA
jgi:hypothetical protein